MSNFLKLLKEHDILTEASISRGMLNKFSKDIENAGKTCDNCGLKIPKYAGRYPKECPNCGIQFLKPELTQTKASAETEDIPATVNEKQEYAVIKLKGKYYIEKFKHYHLNRNEPEFKGSILLGIYDSRKEADAYLDSKNKNLDESAPKEYDWIELTHDDNGKPLKFPYFIGYIDSTHVASTHNRPDKSKYKGTVKNWDGWAIWHIGQFNGTNNYKVIKNWMKTGKLNEEEIEEALSINKNEKIFRQLFDMGKDKGDKYSLEEYLDFLKKHFPAWKGDTPPHISDMLKRSKSENEFIRNVKALGLDEEQIDERSFGTGKTYQTPKGRQYRQSIDKDKPTRIYRYIWVDMPSEYDKVVGNGVQSKTPFKPNQIDQAFDDKEKVAKKELGIKEKIEEEIEDLDEVNKIKLTNGMTKGYSNKYSKEKNRHCSQCGLVVPTYPGRKLVSCPDCGGTIIRPTGSIGVDRMTPYAKPGETPDLSQESSIPLGPYGASGDLDYDSLDTEYKKPTVSKK